MSQGYVVRCKFADKGYRVLEKNSRVGKMRRVTTGDEATRRDEDERQWETR